MQRQPLTDGSGKWFDLEAAEKFEEDTFWNGRNHISRATGTQFEHESLYYTKVGKWIRHCWSQWQGSTESWEEITDAEAAKWLVTNGKEHPKLVEQIEALEIK